MNRRAIRKLIISILEEGAPRPGKGGMAGLFSDEMRAKIMADAGEDAYDDGENTEELIPYSDGDLDDYDISRQVMKTPMSRIRSIPGDARNPYVPGETYLDTQRRVTDTAERMTKTYREKAAKRAAERKAKIDDWNRVSNRSFVRNRDPEEGTGVLPYPASADYFEFSEDTFPIDSLMSDIGSSSEDEITDTSPDLDEMLRNLKSLSNRDYTIPDQSFMGDSDEEKTLKLDRSRKRIDETMAVNTDDQFLSRGALYRRRYYGRY